MKKLYLAITLSVLALLALSFFIAIPQAAQAPQDAVKKNGSLLNPLLKYTKFRELKPFRRELDALAEEQQKEGHVSEISVYFRSLTVGAWIGINERGAFSPASVLKIPVMLTYYRLAEKDPSILEKKIIYAPQTSGGYVAGIAQKSPAETGKPYSVDELIGFMIGYSDNNADLLLLRNLPSGALVETFRDFGMDIPLVASGKDFASLKTIATFMRVLYNASYLNEEMSEKALRHLIGCAYRDGIVAGVPEGVTVAHKFGERFIEKTGERQLHEVAIVYYANNPYILAVMTKGSDYGKLSEALREISALVYRAVNSQYDQPDTNDRVEVE